MLVTSTKLSTSSPVSTGIGDNLWWVTVPVFFRPPSLAILFRVGAMSTGDGFGHHWGRNIKFCVAVGSNTQTDSTIKGNALPHDGLHRLCVNLFCRRNSWWRWGWRAVGRHWEWRGWWGCCWCCGCWICQNRGSASCDYRDHRGRCGKDWYGTKPAVDICQCSRGSGKDVIVFYCMYCSSASLFNVIVLCGNTTFSIFAVLFVSCNIAISFCFFPRHWSTAFRDQCETINLLCGPILKTTWECQY